MYYEVNNRLSKLPETHDGLGENIVGVTSFAAAAACPALSRLTAAQIHSLRNIHFCKAELFPNAVLGTLAMPAQESLERRSHIAAFCVFPDAIIFLDDSPRTEHIFARIMKSVVWQKPALPAFFCTFLEMLVEDDLHFLESLETQLTAIEDEALGGAPHDFERRMAALRHKVLALHRYYSQLANLAAALRESPLFVGAESALLQRFIERCGRLEGEAQMLREYAMQVRETYQAQIDLRQNKIMQILTVVTTICMPLTLIVGWFGMNFVGMRELQWPYSYPIVMIFSAIVVALCIWLCKKKRLF